MQSFRNTHIIYNYSEILSPIFEMDDITVQTIDICINNPRGMMKIHGFLHNIGD